MTTLPQSTMARTAQPHGASAAPAAAAFQMTAADAWRVIRNHLWLIALFLVLFGVVGYVVNFIWGKNWPQYTAVGYLRIEAQIIEDPVTNKVSDMSDSRLAARLRTESRMLTADQLFTLVLQKPGGVVRETEWFQQFIDRKTGLPNVRAAKEDMADRFSASPLPDSELLVVSFKWRVPADCKRILEELVDEHLKQQRTYASLRLANQTETLIQMRERFRTEAQRTAEQANSRLATLTRRGMGVPNVGASGMFSMKEVELSALIKQQLELDAARAAARGLADSMHDLIEKQGATPESVDRAIENDSTVVTLIRERVSLEIQRDTEIKTKGRSPNVDRLEELVNQTREKLDERRAELKRTYGGQYLGMLDGQAHQAEEAFKKVSARIEALQGELGELSKDVAELLTFREQEKVAREQQLSADSEYRKLQAVFNPDIQKRIDWATGGRPEIPELPSFPRLRYTLPMALFMGLFFSLGIAFLRELLNDKVRSPQDVSRLGNLNVLGVVSEQNDDPQVEEARLAIFDAPQSATAEQFRQLRTRLQYAASMDSTRSILITGPGAEDGKTTVAANLAAGLALNGRKILLVDANFRKPELHRLFGVSNERGFSDVLANSVSLADAAASTRIPNLSILTSGPRPANAAELIESRLFADFLDHAAEEYDHIILDSAPFLVVAESQALAARVDGVITVVRAHAESRGMLQRMRDSLRQLRAEHIGVILNAVRARGGGYYRRNIKAFYRYSNAG